MVLKDPPFTVVFDPSFALMLLRFFSAAVGVLSVSALMVWRRFMLRAEVRFSYCLQQRPPRPVPSTLASIEGGPFGCEAHLLHQQHGSVPSGFIQLTLHNSRLNTHQGGSVMLIPPLRRNLAKLAWFPSRLAAAASAAFLRGEDLHQTPPSPHRTREGLFISTHQPLQSLGDCSFNLLPGALAGSGP